MKKLLKSRKKVQFLRKFGMIEEVVLLSKKSKGFDVMEDLLKHEEEKSIGALLPIAVFIILFVGSGLLTGDFYFMPTTLAFLLALIAALLQNKKFTFEQKLKVAASGAGDVNIITMCIIYLLAGVFSSVVTAAGGVTSTVNLALSFIPVHLAVTGLFLMGCFISISMGTSCGTIAALAPIAVDISSKTGYELAMCIGAVVSGAMFGDNLSMISDTTIAAVRTQGCMMKDKFKANFFIVLPAAIVTALLFYFVSSGHDYESTAVLDYNLIQVVPYMLILVGALLGINVFLLLGLGTVVSVIVGLYTNSFTFTKVFTLTGSGLSTMYEISIIAILAACISALVRFNGGFAWILHTVQSHISGLKGGQLGIGGLVLMMDLATANNTIAIVLAGPLAKKISEAYNISAKRSASLLDIFSSVGQGLIPYGAQLLSAAALTGRTPLVIMPYLYYPVLMLVCVLVFIALSKNGK